MVNIFFEDLLRFQGFTCYVWLGLGLTNPTKKERGYSLQNYFGSVMWKPTNKMRVLINLQTGQGKRCNTLKTLSAFYNITKVYFLPKSVTHSQHKYFSSFNILQWNLKHLIKSLHSLKSRNFFNRTKTISSTTNQQIREIK